jgi:hypothetical protein
LFISEQNLKTIVSVLTSVGCRNCERHSFTNKSGWGLPQERQVLAFGNPARLISKSWTLPQQSCRRVSLVIVEITTQL